MVAALLGMAPRVASAQCYHRGIDANGRVNLVPEQCPFPVQGMVAPLTSGPTYANLQATYDLDITYIERLPRYPRYCVKRITCCGCDDDPSAVCVSNPGPFCSDIQEALGPSCDPSFVTGGGACQGLVADTAHPNGKRWPDQDETVTYRAHVRNKGGVTSPTFQFTWKQNGVVVGMPNQSHGSVGAGQETFIDLTHPFPPVPTSAATQSTIELSISFTSGSDLFAANNKLKIYPYGLAFRAFVSQEMYDRANHILNGIRGTYSFEDWLQWHIEYLNETVFPGSAYAGIAPEGVRDRIFVDHIDVVADLTSRCREPKIGSTVIDNHFYCEDGCETFPDKPEFDTLLFRHPRQLPPRSARPQFPV